mmetsp:Transcript_16854/g.56977  ORF Transcript_16854/g.56977 Transcript_16854/m.56977 type:complete len:240 (+) Transcript_16854:514-1233(+)
MERQLVQCLQARRGARLRSHRDGPDAHRGARHVCKLLPQFGGLHQHVHRLGSPRLAAAGIANLGDGPVPARALLAHVGLSLLRRARAFDSLGHCAEIRAKKRLFRKCRYRHPRRRRAHHRRELEHAVLQVGLGAGVFGPRHRRSRIERRDEIRLGRVAPAQARHRHVYGAAVEFRVAGEAVLRLCHIVLRLQCAPASRHPKGRPLREKRRRPRPSAQERTRRAFVWQRCGRNSAGRRLL